MSDHPFIGRDDVQAAIQAKEFKIIDIIEGTDEQVAKSGDMVRVHYTGWLIDGTQFDSSRERGPFSFELGSGQVIKGWDDGVAGMKQGGKRILVLPSDYAYGDRGAGAVIPPGATLVFEVDYLGSQQ